MMDTTNTTGCPRAGDNVQTTFLPPENICRQKSLTCKHKMIYTALFRYTKSLHNDCICTSSQSSGTATKLCTAVKWRLQISLHTSDAPIQVITKTTKVGRQTQRKACHYIFCTFRMCRILGQAKCTLNIFINADNCNNIYTPVFMRISWHATSRYFPMVQALVGLGTQS